MRGVGHHSFLVMSRVFRISFLLFAVGIGLVVFAALAHAIAIKQFRLITRGMTQAQVRNLLGAPEGIRSTAQTPTAFCYGGLRRLRWCTMEVYFGTDGLVAGTFHDH